MAARAFTIRTIDSPSGPVTPWSERGLEFVWTAENGAMPRGMMDLPATAAIKERTHYPGNEGNPTEQRLGWELEDGWTVSGQWDRRRMGTGGPEQTKANMEALVKSSARVAIQIDGLRYVGFIDKFQPVMTPFGFSYTLTISPHSETSGGRLNPGGLRGQTAQRSPDEYAADVASMMASAADRHVGAPLWAFSSTYHTDLGTLLLDVSQTVDAITGTLATREDAQVSPIEVVRATVSLFAQARTLAATAASELDSVDSTTVLAWDNPVGILAFESWSRGIASDMRELQWRAHEATIGLGARIDPTILALYKPRKHESLYAIAKRFYGNPLLWREIHTRNRLEYTNLVGNECLVIPVLG